jgi:hypothetical protein
MCASDTLTDAGQRSLSAADALLSEAERIGPLAEGVFGDLGTDDEAVAAAQTVAFAEARTTVTEAGAIATVPKSLSESLDKLEAAGATELVHRWFDDGPYVRWRGSSMSAENVTHRTRHRAPPAWKSLGGPNSRGHAGGRGFSPQGDQVPR